MAPRVLSVSSSQTHSFSKPPVPGITLIANHGVKGDCHAGKTTQHRSSLQVHPPTPNLRQVHLIAIENLKKIASHLTTVDSAALLTPGALGQNITLEGIDLLNLPTGTELHFVSDGGSQSGPVLVLTGVRDPGPQIERFQAGLKERFIVRDAERRVVGRLVGVMSVVQCGGEVRSGMGVRVVYPVERVPLGIV